MYGRFTGSHNVHPVRLLGPHLEDICNYPSGILIGCWIYKYILVAQFQFKGDNSFSKPQYVGKMSETVLVPR